MLNLSRNLNEKVYIGNDITVMVTRVVGNKVGLGIVAPRDIPIWRDDSKKYAPVPGPVLTPEEQRQGDVARLLADVRAATIFAQHILRPSASGLPDLLEGVYRLLQAAHEAALAVAKAEGGAV